MLNISTTVYMNSPNGPKNDALGTLGSDETPNVSKKTGPNYELLKRNKILNRLST